MRRPLLVIGGGSFGPRREARRGSRLVRKGWKADLTIPLVRASEQWPLSEYQSRNI